MKKMACGNDGSSVIRSRLENLPVGDFPVTLTEISSVKIQQLRSYFSDFAIKFLFREVDAGTWVVYLK